MDRGAWRSIGNGVTKELDTTYQLNNNNKCWMHCCSVAHSCLTLWDHMDCSMPGFPDLHHLPELAQTYVHWIDDVIQPSCPPSSLLLLPSIFPSIRVFSNESVLRIRSPKYWSFSLVLILPVNIKDCFPLGLTGLISLQSKGLPRIFSNTSSKASIFWHSAVFLVQLSHL